MGLYAFTFFYVAYTDTCISVDFLLKTKFWIWQILYLVVLNCPSLSLLSSLFLDNTFLHISPFRGLRACCTWAGTLFYFLICIFASHLHVLNFCILKPLSVLLWKPECTGDGRIFTSTIQIWKYREGELVGRWLFVESQSWAERGGGSHKVMGQNS